MSEQKIPLIVAGFLCIISGAAGAIVGYRMNGFTVWPHGENLFELALYGTMIGVVGAIITALLLSAAAREKLWLVGLVGCILIFAGGYAYGAKHAGDLQDFGARMFRKD